MTLPMKIVCIGTALFFLVLGVVGLVLPMMPGLIFVAIAMLLLARVSVRFDVWSRRDPRLQTFRQRMAAMSVVGLSDRLKLAGWMALDALVKGTASVAESAQSLIRRVTPQR